MTIVKQYTQHSGISVPVIEGAGGGGKGGGKISPNSLLSTDILLLTTAIGEGPVYRINSNGPQDIQIQDSSIDDLININTDGKINGDNFYVATAMGTVTQAPLPKFGDAILTPQSFASAVSLRAGPPTVGDTTYAPKSSVTSQQTSAFSWDAIRFLFSVDQLSKTDSKGNVGTYSVTIRIKLYNSLGTLIPIKYGINSSTNTDIIIKGKTDKPYRKSIEITIDPAYQDDNGYLFDIEKVSADSNDSKIQDTVSVLGWVEIENKKQAYPRTALIGYALKAVNEHTGGVPNFTSMVKGLLVKVPSNYNQPVLTRYATGPSYLSAGVSTTAYAERAGEIDWREIELPETGSYGYTTNKYSLQKPGAGTALNTVNPQIYVGTWDGTFVYSWTQNPIWIIYDILTNATYGLGIPEDNIDKYRFYQVAQYCDACDPVTGKFIGVDGLADGSYRNKPRGLYTDIKDTLRGVQEGTPIKERRFISDISVVDQEKSMDLLNKIAATFRGMLVYSGSKITLAVDMPGEYPVMQFNEATIKQGTFQISGTKESEVYTGIDVNYIDPTNHFKRETVRVNTADSNDGTQVSDIENIASLDLFGVTRRSQAVRMAQYQIAASKYQRRNISFTTGTDAISLAPGDVISIASRSSGIAYGYGGKVASTSLTANTTVSNITLEHFTVPSLANEVFTQNTYPLSLRILNQASDRLETYIISNTVFDLTTTANISSGVDLATVKVLSRFNKASKTFVDITSTGFTANLVPTRGDLWSLGELQNPLNYYSNKADKLFKVTNLKREPGAEEVTVNAVEYISDVYVDSDTFINYQPTAYTDIPSAFSTPPTPDFTLSSVPRVKLDGTVVVDGVISTSTQKQGYGSKFETEYYISTPGSTSLVANVTATTPLTFLSANAAVLKSTATQAILTGKNGFVSQIGKIKLLCNTVTTPLNAITFTVEGLSSCIDLNYNTNVLDVIPNTTLLKGVNRVVIPVITKVADAASPRNFIGYKSVITDLARALIYDTTTNTITIEDEYIGTSRLSSLLPPTPFYISINQVLNKDNYANNSFYLNGTEYTYISTGTLTPGTDNTITLDIKPRDATFIRFYVDGIVRNIVSGVNLNKTINLPSNIVVSAGIADTTYRVEVDHYTVPTVEVGDLLEISAGNVYTVANSSYDISNAKYNAALTSNSIFRVELASKPSFDLNGYKFINISPNPEGYVNNVSGSSFTFDYNTTTYPGSFKLANSKIYSLELDSTFTRYFLSDDSYIPELRLGSTSIKARNKNTIGRYSPYVQKSVFVASIPIQKVENLELRESLYIEQTGGASVRITVLFDAIQNQQVTDYEISYKLVTSGQLTGLNTDLGTPLQDYNTVKVSGNAIDTQGKIRYTISNTNRGLDKQVNSITVRVTPLNRTIRGVTTELSSSISGKTATPLNVKNVGAGQQNDYIIIFWEYERDANDNLYDLDLEQVEIRRIPGTVAITLDNFIRADKLTTIAPPTASKTLSIDTYDTFTYLIQTRDTSGNASQSIVGITLTTIRSQNSTTVAAYNEDNPSEAFTLIPNTNASEYNFSSFANSITSGIVYPNGTRTDNANGSSSGWSVLVGTPTDLKAAGNAEYYTQIRDFGQVVTGTINFLATATQEIQSTYNDQHDTILDSVTDTISTGFNYFNNVSIAAKELAATDIYFSNTGKYMYVLGNSVNANVYQYNLTSEWDVATAVYESNILIGVRDSDPEGLFFKSDGTKMYFVGATNDRVYEYNLGTPWVVNTAIHLQNVSITSQDITARGVAFSNTGSSMYVLGGATNNIYQYTLSTPWNVTTATFTALANITPQDNLPTGLAFSPTGTRAYVTGSQRDNIYRYTLSEAWNIATLAYSSNIYIGTRETNPTGLYVNNTESSIYIVGTGQNRVQQFTSAPLATTNVLIDSDYGGIGYFLGYNNPSKTTGRYDNTNATWVDGDTDGNVWAIWNNGQFIGDIANANSYALIAGLINANAIAIGKSYYANGQFTGGNTFANVTRGGSSYTLVNLRQYSDLGTYTYIGKMGAVSSQTFFRTAVDNVYHSANGSVNSLAFSSSGDGFVPYYVGRKTFRYLQFKYVVTNKEINNYDYNLDKMRYSIEKEKTSYTNTFVYSNTSMTVDYSGSKFLNVPTLSVSAITVSTGTTNLVTAIYTAISNSSVTLQLARTDGTGLYPANGTATIMLTAQGV